MKKNNLLAFLAILTTALMGATNGVAVKIALREIDPSFGTFLRCLIAFIVILPFFIKERRFFDRKSLKVILLSLINTGNILFFAYGIIHTTATTASLLYTLMPVIVLILSYFLLRQSVAKKKAISIVLGFIGGFIIIFQPSTGASFSLSGSLFGNALIFCAVMCFALYTTLSKKFNSHYSPIYLTTYFIGLTMLAMLLIRINSLSTDFHSLSKVSLEALAATFFTGVMTVMFYGLYQYTIKHVSPVAASIMTYLQPVLTFLLGSALLEERLTIDIVVGAAFAFVAAYIVTKSNIKTADIIT